MHSSLFSCTLFETRLAMQSRKVEIETETCDALSYIYYMRIHFKLFYYIYSCRSRMHNHSFPCA